jgi:8-oxo-dGTP pyrophosphatase MutT (NUDIX family)/phosphohistidine phosphatase SixA
MIRHDTTGPRVLLVHRPRQRDWSLPKGKLDPGEHVVAAAVRECDEETGIAPILGLPLPQQAYQVLGRPKTVDYWVARPGANHGFTRTEEIDALRWVSPGQARVVLTYPRDFALLERAMSLPETRPFIVLRHTAAMKRSDYKGKDDAKRPLTGKGRSHAKALVGIMAAFGIDRVHSSDAVRCMESVRPLASSCHLTVDQEPLLSEQGFTDHPKAAVRRVCELASLRAGVLVCSHRPVLPSILESFAHSGGRRIAAELRDPLRPGEMAVIHRTVADGEWHVVGVQRITLQES